jgi:hypothetical protein
VKRQTSSIHYPTAREIGQDKGHHLSGLRMVWLRTNKLRVIYLSAVDSGFVTRWHVRRESIFASKAGKAARTPIFPGPREDDSFETLSTLLLMTYHPTTHILLSSDEQTES